VDVEMPWWEGLAGAAGTLAMTGVMAMALVLGMARMDAGRRCT
jgi:hypothetical protein